MNLGQFYKDNHHQQTARIRKTMRYNKGMAEDIVQEAYVRAVKYKGSYDPERATVNAWFNGILYNTLRSTFAKQEDSEELDDRVQPLDDPLKYDIILEGIHEQKDNYNKRILHLYYVLGYSSREISEIEEKTSITNVTSVNNKFKKHMIEKYGEKL